MKPFVGSSFGVSLPSSFRRPFSGYRFQPRQQLRQDQDQDKRYHRESAPLVFAVRHSGNTTNINNNNNNNNTRNSSGRRKNNDNGTHNFVDSRTREGNRTCNHRLHPSQSRNTCDGIFSSSSTIQTTFRTSASGGTQFDFRSDNSLPHSIQQQYYSHQHQHQHQHDPRGSHRQRFYSSFRSHSTESRPRRSPYAVLGLRNHGGKNKSNTSSAITKDNIKTAFRRLAKKYHPDLNPNNRPREECEARMSELVDAYERLLKDEDDDFFLENVRSSNKVALACELYSVDELTMDRFHVVHALQLDFGGDGVGSVGGDSNSNTTTETGSDEKNTEVVQDEDFFGSLPASAASFSISVRAHPADSVSDLKGTLEAEYGAGWGLEDCLGWELLAVTRNGNESRSTSEGKDMKNNENDEDENDEEDEDPSTIAANNEVLSYHLFLDDYQIQHGDTIYAVVRKNDNDD